MLRRALAAAQAMDVPGTIVDLGVSWDVDGSWKRFASSTGVGSGDGQDDRRQRVDTPQYQYEADRLAAGG